MTDSVILRVRALTKGYRRQSLFKSSQVLAVDSLDMEVYRGEIFGFLGPNAAGKTTTLNMLVGIIIPTSGSIEIFGKKFVSGSPGPLWRIGYVPEATMMPDYLTVFEILDFYAQLFHLSGSTKQRRIDSLLKLVGLDGQKHELLRNLSMGQRRLVDIVQALINDPELILLDEPTVYLDPVILERFRSMLRYLKATGKTIFMSSHMLSEIEKLSDRIAVIDRGRLLKVAAKKEFLSAGTLEEEFLKLVKRAHD